MGWIMTDLYATDAPATMPKLPQRKAAVKPRQEEGRSEAEIIREAINTAVRNRRGARPQVPLTQHGLGDPTVAERVDELLEGFGRS